MTFVYTKMIFVFGYADLGSVLGRFSRNRCAAWRDRWRNV